MKPEPTVTRPEQSEAVPAQKPGQTLGGSAPDCGGNRSGFPHRLGKFLHTNLGRVLRWMPFTIMVIISLCVAAGVGRPRKPFSFNLSLSWEEVAFSAAKVKHYECIALFFFLVVLAVGTRRARVPFWISMALGLGYEIAESTAMGHTARVADLIPDTLSALGCLAVLLLFRRMAKAWRRSQENGFAASIK